jgi:hypothetical protein
VGSNLRNVPDPHSPLILQTLTQMQTEGRHNDGHKHRVRHVPLELQHIASQASVCERGGWQRFRDEKAGSAFRRCRRVRGCGPSSGPRNPGNFVFGLDVYGKICRPSSHANFLTPPGKDMTSTAVFESEGETRATQPKAPFFQWKSYNAWTARYGTSLHSEFIATARCSRRNCRGVACSRLSKTSFRNY